MSVLRQTAAKLGELPRADYVCLHMLRRVFSFCIFLSVLALLAYLVYPYARHSWALMQLMREEMALPLPVPVKGVSSRRLVDTWHASRSGGRRHEGIDIFAKCGTPVVSATRGVVVGIGDNRLGGRTVRVMGSGGHWHYYAHLSDYAELTRGDWVSAGDTLGFVGNTGNAAGTPCHLHYGVYKMRGGAINPYPLLTNTARSHTDVETGASNRRR